MSNECQIIGKSKHAAQLRTQIARLAANRKDTIVVGEAGVGKTTVASLITAGDSAVAVDFACLPDSALEAVLSAVVEGAVLLEGIELSSRKAQEVVSNFICTRRQSVRIVLTSSVSAKELRGRATLVQKLCAEIAEFECVEIRPLRERPEDIPQLVKHFANGLIIDINTLETLVKLPWTQNIRQLKSIVEECISSAQDGRFVLPEELVDERTEVAKMVSALMESQKHALDTSLDVIENTIILRTLERFGFNESKAAEFLGMTEMGFGQTLKRLALARSTSR